MVFKIFPREMGNWRLNSGSLRSLLEQLTYAIHQQERSLQLGPNFSVRANDRIVFTLIVRILMHQETAVTLDVFYDVWRKASTYDPANGCVVGWVMNQARSRAIDRLRFSIKV